jgi:hypothetical protein
MASTTIQYCTKELKRLLERLEKAVEQEYACRRQLIVTCSHRSVQEQFELWQLGRVCVEGIWIDNPDARRVTNFDGRTVLSKHNFHPTHAFDFYMREHGKPLADPLEYVFVGSVIQDLGFVWGGTWDEPATRDVVHKRLSSDLLVDPFHVEEAD